MPRLRIVGLILLIVATLVLLPGCWVMSVYPLYEENERQPADPGLAGQWWQADGDCRLDISVTSTWAGEQKILVEYSVPEKGGDENKCVLDDGEGPLKFQGRLVDLQGHLFLDLLPAEPQGSFQMVVVHSVFRVTVRNDELDLVPLHPEFVEKAIRHDTIQGIDGPLVSVPTAEWRKFVLGVLDDVSAFPEVVNDRRAWHFTRMPAGVAPRKAPQKRECAEK